MKHFKDVTIAGNAASTLNLLSDDTLLIYSPTSLRMTGATKLRPNMVNCHTLAEDVSIIEAFCKKRTYRQVMSIGGGTAIDIGKYVATLYSCKFICVPTMLSTNAFSTDKVALVNGGKKFTFNAKTPDKIIFDNALISKAGKNNIYGLCDVLSIHTALYDWDLAEKHGKEKINQHTYQIAQSLLKKTMEFIVCIPKNEDQLDLRAIYEIVGESGYITNTHGSGRPESGSEHIFAREMESKIQVRHGISVSAGIALMSTLQNNMTSKLMFCLEKLGTLQAIRDSVELQDAVRKTLLDIEPRQDRYSILDLVIPEEYEIDAIFNNLIDPIRHKEPIQQ